MDLSKCIGCSLEESKELLLQEGYSYRVHFTQGIKDQENLTEAYILQAHEKNKKNVELMVSYFKSPLY